jgi:hypothetical protein
MNDTQNRLFHVDDRGNVFHTPNGVLLGQIEEDPLGGDKLFWQEAGRGGYTTWHLHAFLAEKLAPANHGIDPNTEGHA